MPEPADWVSEIEVRGLIVGAFQENCWVIGNRRTREAICIDPGEQADDIVHLAKDMGVEIKLIATSHGHLDHVLGIHGVQSATNATFMMHEHDLEILRGAAEGAASFGMQVEQPPDPDYYIAEDDEIEVDGVKLSVIHTPGHTRGSVSFFGAGMLFSGDTLFRQSIGRTDLPGRRLRARDEQHPRQAARPARRDDRAARPHGPDDAQRRATPEPVHPAGAATARRAAG